MGQPNGMYLRERKVRISFPFGGAQGRFAASPGTTSTGNGGIPVSRPTRATVSGETPHEGTAETSGRRTHAVSTSNRAKWSNLNNPLRGKRHHNGVPLCDDACLPPNWT
jgi:hypothetical protein